MAEKQPSGRPRKFTTVAQIEVAIASYFAECDARVREVVTGPPTNRQIQTIAMPTPYTVQGLAVALDLTTEGLREYGEREEFSATVKKAKAVIEANKVVHMLDGDGYGAGYIFDLKHNHDWRDQREVKHSGGVTVRGDPVDLDPADIATIERVRRLQLGDDN